MAQRRLSLAVVMASIAIFGFGSSGNRKNVCPIDGQPPQWVGQRKGDSCEYFHYSDIERKAHSWWADCAKQFPTISFLA